MSSFAVETVDLIVRAFVLMSAAWLAALVLRRRSASLRAGIWTVAFASLLALPAISRVTPAWRIAVLPAIEAAPAPQPVATQFESSVLPLSPKGPAEQRAAQIALEPERPNFQGRRSGGLVEQSALRASTEPERPNFEGRRSGGLAEQSALRESSERQSTPVSLGAIALGIWAAVAGLLLVRIGVNRIAAARLIRNSATVCAGDASWREDVESARRELRISRRVGIRFTDAVAVPAVIGVWRPTLLLPLDAGEWTADARRVVILHELAHVARWDAFDQLITEAGCALYWIVPPVWIAARNAASLREQATDDAVIRAGVRPSAYASELIDLAQNVSGADAAATSLAMAGSRIQDRVTAILDPSVRRGRVTIGGALALIIVAGLAVTTLAAISPEHQVLIPPTPPAPPAPSAPPAPPATPAQPAEVEQFPPMPPPAPPAPPAPLTPPVPPSTPAPMAPMAPMAPGFPPDAPAPGFAPLAPPAPYASTPAPAPRAPMAPPAPMAPMTPPPAMAMAPIPPMPPGTPGLLPGQTRGSTSTTSSGRERSVICPDGRDSFSNMSNNNGSRQEWSLKISGRGCTVELKSEGKIEFNDDFTDVASITPSGYFRLTVNRDGGRRQYEIDGRGTSLTRTYRVDGSARTFDAAAKSWLADFLIELDRETAVGVDVRLPKLLKQGGVDAVLKETGLMTSDYARGRYYRKLGESVKLSSAETVRILNQAASLGTQDYYAAELLKSLAPHVGDSSSDRAALLGLVGNMKSDYYIVEGVNSVFTTRAVTASDVGFLMRIMPRVESDYYKQAMVKRIVESGRVDGTQRGALAQVLTTMKEDYYMSAVLADLMRNGGSNAAGRQALISAVARIKSAYYATEAVRSILRDTQLDESDLGRLVAVVDPMREDHYKAESLSAILRHPNASAKIRQSVIDASAGMSRHYADQVRRAAGERVR
jgi:beta-lactamase regulating signal transducer with metallopeptidase domain